MDYQEFEAQFEAEARRLRLNMLLLPGLAGSGTGWEAQLVARMRALEPGCSWADIFPGVSIPEPPSELLDLVTALDVDPEAYWRKADIDQALWREIERVLPGERAAATREGHTFAVSFPRGAEHALRALRSLPDGAGWGAVAAAFEFTPPSV